MLARVGEPLAFGVFFVTTSGAGLPGLSVTGDIRDGLGNVVISGRFALDFGGGIYALSHSSANSSGMWSCIFITSASSALQIQLADAWIVSQPWVANALSASIYTSSRGAALDNLDARISSRAPGGALVTYGGPVAQDSEVNVVAGDDYLLADGRQLSFTADTSGAAWPSFVSRQVQMTVVNSSGAVVLGPVTGTASSGSGTATVTFELSSTQTSLFAPGQYGYDIQLSSTTGGHIATLVISNFNVMGGYTS